MFADEEAGEPVGDADGWFRADALGEVGEPLGDWCGIIVDDVVDAGLCFESGDGSGGGVVQVEEGPDAGSVSDERDFPFTDIFDCGAVGGDGAVGTVERAVTKNDAGDARFVENCGFKGSDRVEDGFHARWRVWVERVFFGFESGAGPGIGPACEALSDKFFCACVDCGGKEVAGAFGAEAIGEGEVTVEVAEIDARRNRCELMNDDLRLDLSDAFVDGLKVECVEDDGGCAEIFNEVGVGGVAKGAEDFVLLDEKGDERLAYGSRCSC